MSGQTEIAEYTFTPACDKAVISAAKATADDMFLLTLAGIFAGYLRRCEVP
jgi:hypothetical protein